jgi:hypothetical protein
MGDIRMILPDRELDNQMQQALKQNSMHQQLLQHMIEQQDLEIYDLMLQVIRRRKSSRGGGGR